MNLPPFLVGAGLAFWGAQSGNLAVGIALGLALEAPRLLRVRLDLGTAEHSTIADLSTVGFVLLAVLLSANRGISRGILEAFIWMPVTLSPILAAQLVTAGGRIPLSALFRYMRRLRRANPEIRDPMVDVAPVYFALTLLAAGVANQRGTAYYAGVVAGTACLLFAARPRRANLAAGVLLLGLAAALGHFGHLGLAQLQLRVEEWILDINLRVVDADPYRTRTEIGSLGRLKLHDTIVLRVFAPEKDAARVALLHRGSYNVYIANTWVARGALMEPLESEADNETWILAPSTPEWRVRIATRLESGRALLALPPGTVRVGSFPANLLRRNALGSVHATLAVDWAQYEAQGGPAIAAYGAPNADDTAVPAAELPVFERVAAELGLRGLAAGEAMRRVDEYFSRFAYATYRERAVPKDETALGDFMTRTRAGHCEYFASAATLLLRAAGIPARYATGYAVMEYSRLEKAFVVRARHAHAWTRAWNGERWVDIDPTPAAWFAEEEHQAPLWQGLSDLLRWAGFSWSQRGEFKAGDAWYLVLAVLAVVLAWRVLRGRRVLREETASAAAVSRRYPGEDSEFYAVESTLPPREPGETHAAWVARISSRLGAEEFRRLRDALVLHTRYRFDPLGLGTAERAQLRDLCRVLAPHQPSHMLR